MMSEEKKKTSINGTFYFVEVTETKAVEIQKDMFDLCVKFEMEIKNINIWKGSK